MSYTILEKEELDKHKEQLIQNILSEKHVLHGNPFHNSVETMFEEFGIWRQEFFKNLQAVLNCHENNSLIVVKYTEVNGTIEFTKGYRLPTSLDFDMYNDLGFELDFIGNGAESLLFDGTYDWCIGTIVDVHFTGAIPAIMDLFYTTSALRSERKKAFEDWMKTEHLLPAYKAMSNYIQ